MSYEDILIGSTPQSLKAMPGVDFEGVHENPEIDSWAGLLVEAPLRGQNWLQPGVDGLTGATLYRDAFEFSIGPFRIAGATRPEMLARLFAVRALFDDPNQLLTRRLHLLTIAPFYGEDSCNGQYVGLPVVATPTLTEVLVVLNLRNLDGGWS